VVFLHPDSLLPVRSEDRQRIAQHFLIESLKVQVDVRLAPALWLAFFKLRNACRANRLSLYWQRELEVRHGVYSLGDYLSVARGGETRGRLISDDQRQYNIRMPDDDKDLPEMESKHAVPIKVSLVDEKASEDAILDAIYKSRAPLSTEPITVFVVLSDSAEVFETWQGVERVMVLSPSEPALRARIHQFLRFHLPCFSRTASPGLADLDGIRSKLLRPTSAKRQENLHASLSAFREAVEVGEFCGGGDVVFGRDVLARSAKDSTPVSVDRVSLPDQQRYAEPISVLGSNEAFRHAKAKAAVASVNITAIPNLFNPTEDTEAFKTERPAVQQIFKRQFAALQSVVETAALQSYRFLAAGSQTQFNHFYATLPMIRTPELQALLAHITTAMRTQHGFSALIRLQCGGPVSDSRAAAWALGLHHRRLALGGVGTEVSEFWVDPKIEATGNTPDEIALKYAKDLPGHLAHPLERHARLRKLLREGGKSTMTFSSNLYGYLSALSAYLR